MIHRKIIKKRTYMFILGENLKKELRTLCSTLRKKKIGLRKQRMITKEIKVDRISGKKEDLRGNR